MRTQWEATNPQRQHAIFMQLMFGDKSFTELHNDIRHGRRKGWAKQTLNLYLKYLIQQGCIKRVERGRRGIYSLVKNNQRVNQWWKHLSINNVRKKVPKLNEDQFIKSWLNTLNFAFLNIIQYYITIGKGMEELSIKENGTKPLEFLLLQENLSDILDIIQFHGKALAEGIKHGELNPEKVWDTRNRLLDELKAEIKKMPNLAAS